MNKIIKSFIIILCCAYISSCYNAIDASFKEENNSGSFLLSPTISTSFSSLNSESTGVNGSEGLEYEYDDSNYTCTLVGVGTFKGEKLIIPSKVNVNEKNYTVTEIEVFSFSNCIDLESIFIPKEVKIIKYLGVAYCSKLTKIEVDVENQFYKSVEGNLYTKDGKMLIQYALGKKEEEFEVPKEVENIGPGAFLMCQNIKKIIIPEDINNIGPMAFDYCPNLVFNEYENGYYIGSKENQFLALEGTKVKDCKAFKINDNAKFILDFCFWECELLEKLVIPDKIISIGDMAFTRCSNLINIEFPTSLQTLGYSTFEGCKKIENIYIPSSVTSIGQSSFSDCDNLENINVDESNKEYKSIDGVLFDKEGIELKQYPSGKKIKKYVVPEGTLSLDWYAFYGCENIICVELPYSLTKIGSHSFYYCDSLESIVLPNSVVEIGTLAFNMCGNLTIYCEAVSKPQGWDEYWCFGCLIYWGYEWKLINGEPTPNK